MEDRARHQKMLLPEIAWLKFQKIEIFQHRPHNYEHIVNGRSNRRDVLVIDLNHSKRSNRLIKINKLRN